MSVETHEVTIAKKVRAIIMFGPPTEASGNRAGDYFQVTIDPNMLAAGGSFIRLDQQIQGGEVHGWQRVSGLTLCEILGDAEDYKPVPEGYSPENGATVTMRALAGVE